MTATDKAQLIKNAVDSLGAMLPLEWHDAQGRHICILQAGMRNYDSVVRFLVMLDGKYPKDDDGIFEFYNPPIGVEDGTYHDEVDELTGEIKHVPNIKIDPLAAFFVFIEQAVI